jgi:hypothetical protein
VLFESILEPIDTVIWINEKIGMEETLQKFHPGALKILACSRQRKVIVVMREICISMRVNETAILK